MFLRRSISVLFAVFIPIVGWGTDMAMSFIKRHEGFSPVPYTCQGRQKTIGYGFADKELVARGCMSVQEAESILRRKVDETRILVRAMAGKRILTPFQETALVSFAFNVGKRRYARSRVARLVRNGGSVRAIQTELLKWRYVTDEKGRKVVSAGLYIRRRLESEMFARRLKNG